MRTTLTWASLPPMAQLCLLTASRCQGLRLTAEGFIGHVPHPRDDGRAYVVGTVAQLMLRELATTHPSEDHRVVLTEAGIELATYGQTEVGRS